MIDDLRRRTAAIRRVAWWELVSSRSALDRRAVALVVVTLLLAGGIGGALAVAGADVAPGEDIYRVGVDSQSPYHDPVDGSSSLAPRPPDRGALNAGDLELLLDPQCEIRGSDSEIDGACVLYVDTQKGQAALSAFRSAVENHNHRLMAAEPNATAAFPVTVTVEYAERDTVRERTIDETTVEDTAQPSDDADDRVAPDADDPADPAQPDPTDDEASPDADPDSDAADDDLAVPDVRGGGGMLEGLFGTTRTGSPADIEPPFPFGSLVLAFLFLIPMNFVVQAYGSTILNERINRRGELLLVTPLRPTDIVAGKTLPYLLGMIGVTVAIALAVGGGLVSIVAVVPIALLYLAATFLGGMFARSFKELTFVTVTISVVLTTYVFVPAIFTEVTPIALISPLTLVVMDLQGTDVTAIEYLFSTGPFYLGAAVLFLLGTGIYREEDMFTQRSVPLKFLDALDSQLSRPRSVGVLSALFIPFVFIAELLAIALLFALPIRVSLPILLVVIAVVEEIAKSVHVYAGFANRQFEPTPRMAVYLGALSGTGFFLGEKVTAIAHAVGLTQLPLGQAAFLPAGIGGPVLVGLFLAPLVLHVVATTIASLGASRNLRSYVLALGIAIAIHTLYNYVVVITLV